jgi:hypothetical protein
MHVTECKKPILEAFGFDFGDPVSVSEDMNPSCLAIESNVVGAHDVASDDQLAEMGSGDTD